MLGREALVVLVQLGQTMSEKRDKPLLHLRGQINGQIEIVISRSNSRMIHGAHLPSPLRDRELDRDQELGIRNRVCGLY